MMKLKDLKNELKNIGNESLVKVAASGKYEKEYMQVNKGAKSYEIRFNPDAINAEQVEKLLKGLNLSHVHPLRIKDGFQCASFLVEI